MNVSPEFLIQTSNGTTTIVTNLSLKELFYMMNNVREIKFSNSDKFFIVDEDDYERVLAMCPWHNHNGYARKCVHTGYKYKQKGRNKIILLHRFILNIDKLPHGMVVDHIDRNKSNNSKSNLRIVSIAENTRNHGRPTKKAYFEKLRGWKARKRINGKLKSSKYFKSEEEAIEAYYHL